MAKIIADGNEYEVPTFNLGEFRLLKREFGLSNVNKLDPTDPDHLVGMLFVCARRKDPSVRVEAIENVTHVEFVEDEADPTPAGAPEAASPESTGANDAAPAPAGS
jgi:hypothetical protein